MAVKKKVFLINPPYRSVYEKSIIHLFKFVSEGRKDRSIYPPHLSLATISPLVLESGHGVEIFDLNIPSAGPRLEHRLSSGKPDYVGITFTTPLFNEAIQVLKMVRRLCPKAVIIGGGPHASAFPEKTLELTDFNIAIVGEGDFTLAEIVNGMQLEDVKGIAYKRDGKVFLNPKKEPIWDLDTLPFPAWHLYDLEKYDVPKVVSRNPKVGLIETSRGCPWGCVYCTKCVFGRNFRTKTTERVIQEIKRMLELGFQEFHIADDTFTTNIERAEEICDRIVEEGLKFTWETVNGIRADRVTPRLLRKMRKAGCYRVTFGIETGNEDVMKRINKGESLDTIRNAVNMAKKAGLEVYGSFMMGLPGETEQTMQQTIDFAKELNLDMAKVSITSPLPSTPLYEEYRRKGLIKSEHWSSYNVYSTPRSLYTHETLSWDTIERYYKKFYSSYYMNPGYIIRKSKHSVRNHTVPSDISMFVSYMVDKLRGRA
jgi:anaerobic magnesium-protoporphyrin IX monomethyl ester cyclase